MSTTPGASTPPTVAQHGVDGRRLRSDVGDHLDYLARICDELDIENPVRDRFERVVGQWNDLHDAAQLWRRTAEEVEQATTEVSGKLGGIDSAWQGGDADAFLAHMHEVGLAGHDLVDAMRGLAEALDHTAESVRTIAQDLANLIAESADSVSEALVLPADGEQRARRHLEDLDAPVKELVESAGDAMRSFVRFCEDFDSGRDVNSVALDHMMPAQDWSFDAPSSTPTPAAAVAPAPAEEGTASAPAPESPAGTYAASDASKQVAAVPPSPGTASLAGAEETDLAEGGTSRAVEPSETPPASTAAPAAAVAGGAATAGMAGGMMMPMGMMGGMGQRAGEKERENSSRFKSNAEELFGKPEQAAPPVLGDWKNAEKK
jgi:uncharacterized protein YukE